MQPAACYTMSVAFFGHWFAKIPLSEIISTNFGNDRFAWLLLVLSIDSLGRIFSLFDPD